MTIPNYGEKYDAVALFSPSEAIEEHDGDVEAEVPKAIIITFQKGFLRMLSRSEQVTRYISSVVRRCTRWTKWSVSSVISASAHL